MLGQLSSEQWDIPLIIGGKEIRTGDTGKVVMPHNHKHVLATYHKAGPKEVQMAIDAAVKAQKEWSDLPWVERASVMMRIAELISTKYRYAVNASVMLGQSKNPMQAEIDAPCELIDFYDSALSMPDRFMPISLTRIQVFLTVWNTGPSKVLFSRSLRSILPL